MMITLSLPLPKVVMRYLMTTMRGISLSHMVVDETSHGDHKCMTTSFFLFDTGVMTRHLVMALSRTNVDATSLSTFLSLSLFPKLVMHHHVMSTRMNVSLLGS